MDTTSSSSTSLKRPHTGESSQNDRPKKQLETETHTPTLTPTPNQTPQPEEMDLDFTHLTLNPAPKTKPDPIQELFNDVPQIFTLTEKTRPNLTIAQHLAILEGVIVQHFKGDLNILGELTVQAAFSNTKTHTFYQLGLSSYLREELLPVLTSKNYKLVDDKYYPQEHLPGAKSTDVPLMVKGLIDPLTPSQWETSFLNTIKKECPFADTISFVKIYPDRDYTIIWIKNPSYPSFRISHLIIGSKVFKTQLLKNRSGGDREFEAELIFPVAFTIPKVLTFLQKLNDGIFLQTLHPTIDYAYRVDGTHIITFPNKFILPFKDLNSKNHFLALLDPSKKAQNYGIYAQEDYQTRQMQKL